MLWRLCKGWSIAKREGARFYPGPWGSFHGVVPQSWALKDGSLPIWNGIWMVFYILQSAFRIILSHHHNHLKRYVGCSIRPILETRKLKLTGDESGRYGIQPRATDLTLLTTPWSCLIGRGRRSKEARKPGVFGPWWVFWLIGKLGLCKEVVDHKTGNDAWDPLVGSF